MRRTAEVNRGRAGHGDFISGLEGRGRAFSIQYINIRGKLPEWGKDKALWKTLFFASSTVAAKRKKKKTPLEHRNLTLQLCIQQVSCFQRQNI